MLEQFKFAESDFAGKSISELADKPIESGMTAAELKARFDAIGKIVIAMGKLNDLISYMGTSEFGSDVKVIDKDVERTINGFISTLAGVSGASKVGMGSLYEGDISDPTIEAKLMTLTNKVLNMGTFTPRGILDSEDDLPQGGNSYGDFFYIRTDDPYMFIEYVWTQNPDQWTEYGPVSLYDLENYYTRHETDLLLEKILKEGLLQSFFFDNWSEFNGYGYRYYPKNEAGETVSELVSTTNGKKLARQVEWKEGGDWWIRLNIYEDDGETIRKTSTMREYKENGIWKGDVV